MKKSNKFWTSKEIKFLKDNYNLKNKIIAQKLNRTVGAIARKKSQLKLSCFTKWKKEKIIKILKEADKKLRHSPSTREVRPTLYQACLRFFGSFNEAKKTAKLIVYKQKHHQIKKNIKKLTKELAYILGVVKGDGYCYIRKSKKRTSAVIGLHVKDEDFAMNFKKILQKWSGIEAKNYDNESGYYVGLYSIDCARFIKEYNIKKILKTDKKVKSAFLKGLFDSEGGVIGKNLDYRQKAKRWIHFSNNNLKTIKIISHLLYSFKITHKIKSRVHSGFGSKKVQYEILIYGKENLEKFYKYVGFSIKRKQEGLIKTLNSYN